MRNEGRLPNEPNKPLVLSLLVHGGVRKKLTKLDNEIAARDAAAQLIAGCICAAKKRGTCIFFKKLGIQPRLQCW